MAPPSAPTQHSTPKLLLESFGIEVDSSQCLGADSSSDCETITTGPTPVFIKRQQYTTISVLSNGPASSTAAATPTSTSSSAAFPVAVAIPALVGGMALALIGFGLYWWMAKKKRKEKRRRWEAAQRRQRKRAETAAAARQRRPSVSKGYSEKGEGGGPAVPVLAKSPPQEYREKAYPVEAQHPPGYSNNNTASNPNDPYNYNYGNDHTASEDPAATGAQDFSQSENSPGRPSRSAARAAASDAMAANAAIHKGYKPTKSSRLAGAGNDDSDAQETLGDGGHAMDFSSPNPQSSSNRQVSGEWNGNNHGAYGGGGQYDNDPYLAQQQQNRAPSGQYSVDPYAAYHGGEGGAPPVSKRGGGWV